MPNYINAYTEGSIALTVTLTPGLSTQNEPTVLCESSNVIPAGIEVFQVIVPTSGIYDSYSGVLNNIFVLDNIESDGFFVSETFTANFSGCFGGYHFYSDKNVNIDTLFTLDKKHENTKYSYWYNMVYKIGDEVIFSIIDGGDDKVITWTTNPDPAYLSITSSGVAIDTDNTRLHFNIENTTQLANSNIDNSKYSLQIISRENNQNIYYNYSGGIETSSYREETTNPSGIFNLNLPFTWTENNKEYEKSYRLRLWYYNQENHRSKYLQINTSNISDINNLADSGVLTDSRNTINFKELFVIDKDDSQKYRMSLDIQDIALTKTLYNTKGTFISNYYNLDVPLYSIYIYAKEIVPSNIDPNSIKYYIQFNNNEEHEILPINKINNNIPKMLILDDLYNNSITSNVKQLVDRDNKPVYSFRVKITFDIKTLDGSSVSSNYIPPSIDYYECYITDRESFLRI